MLNNIDNIIWSSRDAIPIQRLTKITTNRMLQVEDPRFVELLVSFYSLPEEVNNFIRNNFKVIMPRTWKPKMYLGCLHQSIRTNLLLTLESIEVSGGRNYTTRNKLNWLFPI